MKYLREIISSIALGGLVILLPIYLTVLLLLKGVDFIKQLLNPLAAMLPEWVPAPFLIVLLLLLALCALIGMAARTPAGRKVRNMVERSFFERLPGYATFRSLTQRLTGTSNGTGWKPALAEIEEALVPAFIIEKLEGDRFTVFVPSVPTPLAGAVYVLDGHRVHPVDVPFTKAVRCISQWGAGSKDLVAAMERPGPAP